MPSRDYQTFHNTDTQNFTEIFSKLQENLRRNGIKDCKAKEIVSFLLRFQGSCTGLQRVAPPFSSIAVLLRMISPLRSLAIPLF